jgi:hypothetical protein
VAAVSTTLATTENRTTKASGVFPDRRRSNTIATALVPLAARAARPASAPSSRVGHANCTIVTDSSASVAKPARDVRSRSVTHASAVIQGASCRAAPSRRRTGHPTTPAVNSLASGRRGSLRLREVRPAFAAPRAVLLE